MSVRPSAPNPAEYLRLQKEKTNDEQLAKKYKRMEELYTEKRWNLYATTIHAFISDKQLNVPLIELWKNAIDECKHRLNPLPVVQMAMQVARSIKDHEEANTFLKDLESTVKADRVATLLLQVGQVQLKLDDKKADGRCVHIEQISTELVELEKGVDSLEGVSVVHGPFYKVSATYYREIGDHSQFYRDALRYLGSVDSMAMVTDKPMWATCLAVAALLAPDVYNFGKLLALPIVNSLPDVWLRDLLDCVNAGDMHKFEKLRPQWAADGQYDLNKSADVMLEKTRLLCVMSMAAGHLPGHVAFSEISSKAKVSGEEVEHLVMKALSLGLIRGSIDQVKQRVFVTWVQPRVLTKTQISELSGSFGEWEKSIDTLAGMLEQSAHSLIVHKKA